jgi:hypothetical protein
VELILFDEYVHISFPPYTQRTSMWAPYVARRTSSRNSYSFSLPNQQLQRKMYLDMLKHFVVPQVEDLQPTVIFQQDGAPPHWGRIVRDYPDATFPKASPIPRHYTSRLLSVGLC